MYQKAFYYVCVLLLLKDYCFTAHLLFLFYSQFQDINQQAISQAGLADNEEESHFPTAFILFQADFNIKDPAINPVSFCNDIKLKLIAPEHNFKLQ